MKVWIARIILLAIYGAMAYFTLDFFILNPDDLRIALEIVGVILAFITAIITWAWAHDNWRKK